MKVNTKNYRIVFAVLLLFSTLWTTAQDLPYPQSTFLSGIETDWSTHQRYAMGSDNFQLTWADDNHQYGIWGDGGGFAANSNYRVSFGVARIEGDYDDYKGFDRYGHKESSEFESKIAGKSWAIICVKGNLYAWVHPDEEGGWGNWVDCHSESRLYKSTDKGASWQAADWAFSQEDDLTGGAILQFGKNNAGALDKYVYQYFVHPGIVEGQNRKETEMMVPGKIYLLRVHHRKIMTNEAYEFFSGFKNNKPVWTKNAKDKKPVFVDNNGVGTPIGISYNPGLNRYILSTGHGKSLAGMLGVFEAPSPWGPWATVSYAKDETWFGHDNSDIVPANCFFWCFPSKWISDDGKSATMVFTGGGRGQNNDSFNSVRVQFIVN